VPEETGTAMEVEEGAIATSLRELPSAIRLVLTEEACTNTTRSESYSRLLIGAPPFAAWAESVGSAVRRYVATDRPSGQGSLRPPSALS
jgi:hypothetical protein